MALLLLKSCAVIYAVAALMGVASLFAKREHLESLSTWALSLGAVGQLWALWSRGSELSSFPMANAHDALSVFGFALAITTFVAATTTRVPQIGPIGSVVVAAVVGIATAIQPAEAVPTELRSAWLPLHIALAFLGNAAFVVAGMVSVIYLIQERRVKRKRSLGRGHGGTGQHKLPALEVLDRMNLRLIVLGLPFMTLALVSGALYGREVWGMYWKWELRNVVSVMVWVLFALLLHFRLTIGWRGRRAAILTLFGVTAALLSIVGLAALGFGHHGMGVAT